MNRITLIKDFEEGMSIRGFYLCKHVENKITRLGDEYIDIILEDSTGVVRAKVWYFVDCFKPFITNGKPVAVKGNIIKYNNTKEINISHINLASEDVYKKYGFNKKNLIKRIIEDSSKLIDFLNKKIKRMDLEYTSIMNLIIKQNLEKIKSIPSLNNKYYLSGGFLLEMIAVLKLHDRLIDLYEDLDKNIVLSGIILKNIGLIKYFNDDIQFTIINKNIDVDVRVLSMNIINEYFHEKKYNSIKLNLQNIVLSDVNSDDKNALYIRELYNFNSLMQKSKI